MFQLAKTNILITKNLIIDWLIVVLWLVRIFYRLQAYKAGKSYYGFINYGRIGTDTGAYKGKVYLFI